MGKKRNNSKKESVNIFKVSEGRAKKAKKNKANIKFKKLKARTNEEVDILNKNLDEIQYDIRKTKQIHAETTKPINAVSLSNNDVNIEKTIAQFSNL